MGEVLHVVVVANMVEAELEQDGWDGIEVLGVYRSQHEADLAIEALRLPNPHLRFLVQTAALEEKPNPLRLAAEGGWEEA